jgi:hypothetical protein
LYLAHGLAELEHYDRYEDAVGIDLATVALPAELHRSLTQLGVTGVTARFDGSGDSGQIEAFTVEPETVVLGALEEELEDFLVEQLPGGWEINAGSFGEFTVDMAAGAVTVQASWRIEKDSDVLATHWHWR